MYYTLIKYSLTHIALSIVKVLNLFFGLIIVNTNHSNIKTTRHIISVCKHTKLMVLLLLSTCICNCGMAQKTVSTQDIDALFKEIYNSENDSLSLSLASKALQLSTSINYKKGMAKALIAQADAKLVLHRDKEAVIDIKTALQYARELEDKKLEAQALITYAGTFVMNQDFEKGFEMNSKALDIAKANNDSIIMANAYGQIAGIYINMHKFEEAEKCITIAYQIYSNNHKHSAIALMNYAISVMYVKQEKYDIAKVYCLKAIRYLEANRILPRLSSSYINLGICYDYANKKDSALYCYYKALPLTQRHNYRYAEIDVCNNIAVIYDDRGSKDSARKYYDMALHLSQQTSNYEMINLVATNLSDFFVEKGNDYKSALEYEKMASAARDTIAAKLQTNKIQELQIKFETKETESRNKFLKKENELQRLKLQRKNFFALFLVIALLLITVSVVLWMRHTKIKTQQEIVELEQKQLRSQMDPHFLFNSLNAIQHHIVNGDTAIANKYVASFASLMRHTLNISSENAIPLHLEIQYLENYLLLEKLRFENKLSYSIHCNEKIDKYKVTIPPMIIQPFVENAIHHGLRYLKDNEGYLKITFESTDNHLICTISDNGIGIIASKKLKENLNQLHTSQGINITQKRLALIGKVKKANFSLTVQDKSELGLEESGTLVTIKFPVV